MVHKSNNSQLKTLLKWRDRLGSRGQNNEKVNDRIRYLQNLIFNY